MSPLRRALPFVLVLSTLCPAAAAASSYSDVLHVYEQRGTIPACTFTAAQLSAALKGVDVYGQQYFADFTDAIQSALNQRAAGQCSPGTSAATTPSRSTRADPSLRIRLPSVTAATGSALPLPLVALLILALIALLAAALEGARRALGLDVGPGGAWRHLWGELAWRSAGWRAQRRDRRPAATRSAPRRLG